MKSNPHISPRTFQRADETSFESTTMRAGSGLGKPEGQYFPGVWEGGNANGFVGQNLTPSRLQDSKALASCSVVFQGNSKKYFSQILESYIPARDLISCSFSEYWSGPFASFEVFRRVGVALFL